MSEKFNEVAPFRDRDGMECCGIETDRQYMRHVGQLWLGSTWLTVAEARELRKWLDLVIPNE